MKAIIRRGVAAAVVFVLLFGLFAFFPMGKQTSAGRYSGYGEAATYAAAESETIYYTRKEETYIETVNAVPLYSQITAYPNSCGAVGGAIIVGFYDKYYPDLVPNYDCAAPNGKYKRNDKTYIPQLMGDLYTLMRTNVDDVGVSQADCLNGLKMYVQNHGKTLSYSSIASSKTVSQTALINAINANKPSLLFCSKMELYQLFDGTNSQTLKHSTSVGDHIVVAYGYLEIEYYNESNNLFRTEKFIEIATGLSDGYFGYLKIEANDWCNAAYAVSVT